MIRGLRLALNRIVLITRESDRTDEDLWVWNGCCKIIIVLPSTSLFFNIGRRKAYRPALFIAKSKRSKCSEYSIGGEKMNHFR